jgi:hypothetical protein
MRTIKLSKEQIQILCQALGIAEQAFTNIHKDIIENTVNVRKHYGGKQEQTNIANYYHVKACEIADLNIGIESGEFDV